MNTQPEDLPVAIVAKQQYDHARISFCPRRLFLFLIIKEGGGMSDALRAAHQVGANLLDISPRDLEQFHRVDVVYLGELALEPGAPPTIRAWRGISAYRKGVGKGGIRFSTRYGGISPATGAPQIVSDLVIEMDVKTEVQKNEDVQIEDPEDIFDWRGAKGMIGADPKTLTTIQSRYLLGQYGQRMVERGLGGWDNDVPAGDMGSNGLLGAYLRGYELGYYVKNGYDDPYLRASVTGKDVKDGGLGCRGEATSAGTLDALLYQMERLNRTDVKNTVTVGGFGNVGANFAHLAETQKNISIIGISDSDGTLYVEGPDGMEITADMAKSIGDNPDFRGNKIEALKKAVEENQPHLADKLRTNTDPNAIFDIVTDWHVSASVQNAINSKTLGAVQKNIRLGYLEAGNGATEPEADAILREQGMIVVPDVLANGLGYRVSLMEHRENVRAVRGKPPRSDKELRAEMHRHAFAANQRAHEVARVYELTTGKGHPDLRLATAVMHLSGIKNAA